MLVHSASAQYQIFAPYDGGTAVEDRRGLHLDSNPNTNLYCSVWSMNQPSNFVAETLYAMETNDVSTTSSNVASWTAAFIVEGSNVAVNLWGTDMNGLNSGFEPNSAGTTGLSVIAGMQSLAGSDGSLTAAFGLVSPSPYTLPDLSVSGVRGASVPVTGTSLDPMPTNGGAFKTFAAWFKPLVALVVWYMAFKKGTEIVRSAMVEVASGNQLQLNKTSAWGNTIGEFVTIATYVPAVVGLFLTFSALLGAFLGGLGSITLPSVTPSLVGGSAAASGGTYATGMNGLMSAFSALSLTMFGVMWQLVSSLFPVGSIVGTVCGVAVLRLKTDLFVTGAVTMKTFFVE